MPEARLELSTDPNQLPALKAALEGQRAVRCDGKPSLITSIYYDSLDRKLHRHGLSLCVEQHDARRVQILRRADPAAYNSQWRDIITSDGPDPSAPETGARLRGLIDNELRPLCRTRVRRTCLTLGVEPSACTVRSTTPSTFNATSSPDPPFGSPEPKRLQNGNRPSQRHDASGDLGSRCVPNRVAVTKPAIAKPR